VFGNGGVGRILASRTSAAREGDLVAIFGHVPCRHHDCRACRITHRYVECEYGESSIIGHGRGGYDGTYQRHVVLPQYSYEICGRAGDGLSDDDLVPFMYAFLVADVRNALTRLAETGLKRRLLLFGGGQSGHIAARLHLDAAPDARVLIVEPSAERAQSIKSLKPDAVDVCELPAGPMDRLNQSLDALPARDLSALVETIAATVRHVFGRRGCDLIFDASSGNALPLWANRRVLTPGCHCVPFGFGGHALTLSREVLQISGVTIQTSRGVGDLDNRRAVVRALGGSLGAFVQAQLFAQSLPLIGLEHALAFIRAQHDRQAAFETIPQAHIVAGGEPSR
jgi:threonine dehydrogenase-like Zn-dependent dehydrogenase